MAMSLNGKIIIYKIRSKPMK